MATLSDTYDLSQAVWRVYFSILTADFESIFWVNFFQDGV